MAKFLRTWVRQLPIRTRLAMAFLLTFSMVLSLFAAVVYLQVQRDLLAQVDAALALASAQATTIIDVDEDDLLFEEFGDKPVAIKRLDNAAIYLLNGEGTVIDALGAAARRKPALPQPGAQTVAVDGERWRVFTEIYAVPDRNFSGWIQVMQPLADVERSLSRLATQLGLGIALALALAGVSGIYLAAYALRPVEDMTRTALAIDESDLARRIDYDGPADEIGRLATTFDGMLDRLQAAFERQTRFTADAAHELRTPLAALKARINVVRRRPRLAAEYEDALDDVDGQVERLIRLTQQLLFLARLDHGPQEDNSETLQLKEFLHMVADQIEPAAAEKSITLIRELTPDLVVYGNMDLLISLFLNLLDNAVAHTPAGGNIDVRLTDDENVAVVAIHDSGSGIPPEYLPHLFERFYRAETDRSRQDGDQRGTGLGLAIAHEIAQIHDGTLTIESLLGNGSTFIVRLPLA